MGLFGCSGLWPKLLKIIDRCEFAADCNLYDPNGECDEASHTRCGKYKIRKYGPVIGRKQ